MSLDHDITTLKLTALGVTANGVIITDRQGTIVWANPAAARMTGYSQAELIGKPTSTLKSGKQDVEMYRDLWTTISAGKSWTGRLINRRKDGSLYHEEMTITPVSPDGEEVTHFVAIKQDVSEAVRADEEQQRLLTDVQFLNERLYSALNGSFAVLADLAALQSPEVGKHGERVGELAKLIAEELGMTEAGQHDVQIAGVLHDIGKAVNDKRSGAKAPGHRFGHAVRGAALLTQVPGSESIRGFISHHHEHYDGSGFPEGLRGEKIPLGSRIIAVASGLDNGMHVAGLGSAEALTKMQELAGSKYDQQILKALARVLSSGGHAQQLDHSVLISIHALSPGMEFTMDVRTTTGMLLFKEGTRVDQKTRLRLIGYRDRGTVVDYIKVRRWNEGNQASMRPSRMA